MRGMKRLLKLADPVVPTKLRRAIQRAQYVLSDRSELANLEPVPIAFGYERIYHFHIRKTAGTSLNFAFRNAFQAGFSGSASETALFRRNWAVHAGRVYVTHNKYLIERGNYFYGDGHAAFHEVNIPVNTFMITIVRDPIKRILSHYRMLLYWKNNDIQHTAREEEEGYLGNSFSDFLDRVPRQHLMRQLFMFSKSLDPAEAVENIKKMNFIMVTEDFTEHLRRLGTVLQMDLSSYAEKSSYGAVKLTERERVRLAEVLEPEYALLRAVAPLAGVHLVGGRPMKTKQANASS
jgi:prepilin-type processing-associated H-X9-DG protein